MGRVLGDSSARKCAGWEWALRPLRPTPGAERLSSALGALCLGQLGPEAETPGSELRPAGF